MNVTLQTAVKRAFALACILLMLCSTALAATKYTTLEFGSRGSDVLKLQKALLSLGYDPKGADGKFGRGTESAVIRYQSANNLTADGKAGTLTLSLIYAASNAIGGGSSGGSSGDSSGDSSGSGTVTTNPNTLKYGDSGDRVTDLQTALVKLGYNTNGVDGRFGAGTQRAVIAFQKAQKLTADGLAGTRTLDLLYQLANKVDGGSGGDSSSGGSSGGGSNDSGSASDGSYTRTLRKGYTGADVTSVQTRLKDLGYYSGALDGVYGTGSIAAVKAFQQKNSLTADGLAGARTFSTLFSSSAIAAGSSGSGDSGSSGGSGGSGDSGGSDDSSSSGAYITLRYGATGPEVKALQKALKELNYNVSADGSYGALTQTAVAAFQKRNGLTSDGVAGAKTQQVLFSGNAVAADPNADDDLIIDGDTGKADGPSTSSVQLLHWYNEIKPSIRTGQHITIFDPATNLQWTLRLYSLGHHADSEPLTLTDTQVMYKAFGNTNTWTPKTVYVKLPSGTWTLASMHNVPHLSGSIKENGFDGHLCVHFLRDMDECKANDPSYGVTNQNAIRKKWKSMTGITVE
ncbi:MAG: peptidoglycan-binding protein [Clostridia bacterium]